MREPDLSNSVCEGYQKIFSFYALGSLALQCGSHFKVHQKPQRSLLNMQIPGGTPSKMPDQYDDAHSNCFHRSYKVEGTQVSIYG